MTGKPRLAVKGFDRLADLRAGRTPASVVLEQIGDKEPQRDGVGISPADKPRALSFVHARTLTPRAGESIA